MNKLTEKRNELYASAMKLVDTAKNETRTFSQAEKDEYDRLVGEIRGIDDQIKAEDEMRSLALKKGNEIRQNESQDQEVRAFENYILKAAGASVEQRDTPVNMTYGANGAVIPSTIMNKVIDRVVDISPIFAAATKYSVKGNVSIPYVDRTSGDITVAFADEFSTLTANGFKFSSIQLQNFLAAALVLLSKQLLNNSQIDVLGYVVEKLAEKIAMFVENFLINGDTAKSSDSGLANSVTNVVNIAASSGITSDLLIDIQDSVPDAYQHNSAWIMNSTTRSQIRKLKDGQGNYLLVPDFREGGSGYLLLGKPVWVTDNLPAASAATAGTKFLYYGDYSGLAVKTGEGAEIQLLTEKYAEQHAIGLNVWFELDCTVENAQKIAALGITPGN